MAVAAPTTASTKWGRTERQNPANKTDSNDGEKCRKIEEVRAWFYGGRLAHLERVAGAQWPPRRHPLEYVKTTYMSSIRYFLSLIRFYFELWGSIAIGHANWPSPPVRKQ